MGCRGCEVHLLIVGDKEITRLNRQYFHRDRPTNVISFPQHGKTGSDVNPHILGDVVVSAETAERHASAVGGTAVDEVVFLMIHGILHLLGYDHEGAKNERSEMESKERELFANVRSSEGKASPRSRTPGKRRGRFTGERKEKM